MVMISYDIANQLHGWILVILVIIEYSTSLICSK